MSYVCTYCNFTAPTRARYMRHLGTQKHARNYLEGTKHLMKETTKKIPNEVVSKCKTETPLISRTNETIEPTVQEFSEEIIQENAIQNFLFLDPSILSFLKKVDETIELSPIILWIISFFTRFNTMFPRNNKKTNTLESYNSDEFYENTE